MKQYNICEVRHDIDYADRKAYSPDDIMKLCWEKSIKRTCSFCETISTHNTRIEAQAAINKLEASTVFFGCGSKGTLRVCGYVMEEAECNEDGEQFDWKIIVEKFKPYSPKY